MRVLDLEHYSMSHFSVVHNRMSIVVTRNLDDRAEWGELWAARGTLKCHPVMIPTVFRLCSYPDRYTTQQPAQ